MKARNPTWLILPQTSRESLVTWNPCGGKTAENTKSSRQLEIINFHIILNGNFREIEELTEKLEYSDICLLKHIKKF